MGQHEKVAYIAIFLIATIAIGSVIFLPHAIKAIIPTQNSFYNHRELPTKINSDSRYEFTFVISNKENHNSEYNYRIISDENGKQTLLEESKVDIDRNSSKEINSSLNFSPSDDTKITVELQNPSQSIAFWIRK